MSEFIEIKRHLNKPDERYRCELVRKDPGLVVLKYVSERAYESSGLGITFPSGCITLAFYREARPYVFWAIHAPAGELLGYLIHICRDLKFLEDSLTYLDLLLDIWFYPDGRHVILDENEVEECRRKGLLTSQDIAYINEAKQAAITNFSNDAKEAAALADTLDISRRSK
jgi:protein associated with RNAse G/E